MTARSRALIIVLSLLGLGFAASSAWVHYKLLTDISYVSPCDISASFNCSQVYLSRYGSIGGVPVALAGLAWFALVGLIAGFARPTDTPSAAGAYIFALATVGLAAILYLGWASFFQLRTGCLLCIGTYVAVIGIFIVSGSGKSMAMSKLPARLPGDLRDAVANPMALLATLVFLVGVTTVVTAFPREGSRPLPPTPEEVSGKQATDFETAWFAQPRVDLGIPADGARVIVVKFNDYECPGCRETHEWYKPILAKFEASQPGAVKYVLKDWPWHSKCNFNVTTTMHRSACEAAAAVRIAREMDKVDEMETWLFENQRTLTPESVRDAAQRILGITNFDAQYPQRVTEIRRDVADGGVLNVKSTPTLFINGVRIDQLMPPTYFEMAINLELKKAGQ